MFWKKVWIAGFALLLFVSDGNCADTVATYDVAGVLRSVDSQNHQATISHEAIPGYMGAMTMNFDVRNFAETDGLRPWDTIAFHLCVTGNRAWIENLRKTGSRSPALFTPASDPAAELVAGDKLPDIELKSSLGKKIRLNDFRGNAVAITFIYTRCPFPTYCPLINRNFQTTQALLSRLVAGRNWRLLTISMDGDRDTSDTLRAFAQSEQADDNYWTFATAPVNAVRDFGRTVGLEFSFAGDQINHNLRTVVVDTEGRIRHVFRGNTWTPQELAAELRSAMPAPNRNLAGS
jgi:protein SCO1/2